jgi:hypothetical protein
MHIASMRAAAGKRFLDPTREIINNKEKLHLKRKRISENYGL